MTIQEPAVTRGGWKFGPGLLVTAAFIGPGTVTTASRAGAEFGFALLWTLGFATLATIVLQEMAARLGLVARIGLAQAIGDSIKHTATRRFALALVLIGIVLGNTAYQTGNLMGAGMGLEVLTGIPSSLGAAAVGFFIAIGLAFGSESRKLHALLVTIVLAMSIAFLATAAVTKPDFSRVVTSIVTISLPSGSLLTALALIGTTIVPYNLFLHATVLQRSAYPLDGISSTLRSTRWDTITAVTLGGVVTMAIVVTAAGAFFQAETKPSNPGQLAEQLVPLFGASGKLLFAAGLVAAGLTSAITAPLAAGYVASEVFPNVSARIAKITAVAIAIVGSLLALLFGKSPLATILVAQAANGLLLPLVAAFLLWVMNHKRLLGNHGNGWGRNLIGGSVVAIACGLGLKTLVSLAW